MEVVDLSVVLDSNLLVIHIVEIFMVYIYVVIIVINDICEDTMMIINIDVLKRLIVFGD